MLNKRYRLKKYSAFNATYRLKNSVADDFMILYLGKEKTIEDIPTKAGFVVSKKIHKRSVKRNRIKRLMRESYRVALKNSELDFLSKNLSVIYMARAKALEADYETIRNSLLTLSKRIINK